MTIPFRPAVRWNSRGHLFLADVVGTIWILVIFAVATKLTWGGVNLVFGAHDLILLACYGFSALTIMAGRGHFDAARSTSLRRDLGTMSVAAVGGVLFTTVLGLAHREVIDPATGYASQLLAAGASALTFMWIVARIGTHGVKDRPLKSRAVEETVVIVGDGSRAQAFADELRRVDRFALPATEFTSPDPDSFERELRTQVESSSRSRMVLAFDQPRSQLQTIAVQVAVEHGVVVREMPQRVDPDADRRIENGFEPISAYVGTRERRWQWHIKLMLDRIGAGLMLVALAPLFAIVAVLIWLEDRGPVFYRQPRVGLFGQTFGVWKFRSMRIDADAVLEEYLSSYDDAREEWAQYQKLSEDPRITRIGPFLRSWSIDELPQLFNVFSGEMSFVGPRPPMIGQMDSYGSRFVFAHSRPGITGLWQVSGRNQLTFEERIELETRYVREWSLWLDLTILVRTIPTVLLRRGAS